MKINVLFFALAFLSSCKDDLTKTPPTESTIIGTWQEYGPKSPYIDANGVVIDSIDINARFQFLADSSFVAENDIYTTSVSGTWSFDSNLFQIKLYPQPPLYNDNSNHVWVIHKLDSSDLEITHESIVNLPGESYSVSNRRNFKRIN